MVSPLDSAVRDAVATAFAGQLLTCTLRRLGAPSSVNEFGDPVPGAAQTWTFDGIRDTFTLQFAQAAGVPVTDAKVLIILGSLATDPQQDDQVKIRSQWLQLRKQVSADPANATQEWAAFEIDDPTS